MHGMQEKVYIIVLRRSLVMPNRDPRDENFRPYLTPMKDTYSLYSSR